MYDLYIANKNYSSWSLRPWVLMRELALPFDRAPAALRRRARLGAIQKALAERQGALSRRRRHRGVGLARHRRIPRRAAPRRMARRRRRARLRAQRRRRDALGLHRAAQPLLHELRRAHAPARDAGRPQARYRAARGAVGRRACPASAARSSPAGASPRWTRSSRRWLSECKPTASSSAPRPRLTSRACSALPSMRDVVRGRRSQETLPRRAPRGGDLADGTHDRRSSRALRSRAPSARAELREKIPRTQDSPRTGAPRASRARRASRNPSGRAAAWTSGWIRCARATAGRTACRGRRAD